MKYQFRYVPESGIGWYLTGAEFLDRGWYYGATNALLYRLRRTLR